jgi:hypothetical protein
VASRYRIGDLVHIPQAVEMVDCDSAEEKDPQLTIPIRIHETKKPEIAIVTRSSDYGYLRVFWDGQSWSVKDDRVYQINGVVND